MHSEYQYIKCELKNRQAEIVLNRPDKRNALLPEMVKEITQAFNYLAENDIRIAILKGSESVFCAGADLNWLKSGVKNSKEENIKDSNLLFDCFSAIKKAPFLTIALVEGSAFGGALGLIAASDIAIAAGEVNYAFSEVKLGLIPATISPFVMNKTGYSFCNRYMLTGEVFDNEVASKASIINHVFESIEEAQAYIQKLTANQLGVGPIAVKKCKELLDEIHSTTKTEKYKNFTSELLADIRQSEEAQEGITSFFEKRKPSWI